MRTLIRYFLKRHSANTISITLRTQTSFVHCANSCGNRSNEASGARPQALLDTGLQLMIMLISQIRLICHLFFQLTIYSMSRISDKYSS